MKKVVLVTMAIWGAIPSASANTYVLTSASTMSVSGTISSSFEGTYYGSPFTSVGGGTLAEQVPGSLTAGLTGSIDADVVGDNVSFTSNVVVANSGNWNPTPDTPSNFGFASAVFMDGSLPYSDFTANVTGAVSGMAASISGTGVLSGSAGNQSFTALIGGTMTSGAVDAVIVAPGLPTTTINVPLSSITLTGLSSGTLVNDGTFETVTMPFTAVAEFTVLLPVEYNGIVGTTTFSMTRHATGEIVAVRAVPEPETYAMLLAGLGLVAGAARRSARQRRI